MVAAMNCKVGNPGRKLVLLKLADNANDKGECWPSFQTIADHCEMGRSTVKMHIKTLEEAGFLTVVERNGGASSNRFLLHLKKGEEIERHTRSKPDPVDPVEIQPGQDLTRSESDRPPVKIQPPPGQDLTPEPVNEPVNEPVKKEARAKFTAPTEKEVDDFAIENRLNLTGFFDYYESNGWMVGKNKMKKWQAAARNWDKRQAEFNRKSNNSSSRRPGEFPSDRIINGEVL